MSTIPVTYLVRYKSVVVVVCTFASGAVVINNVFLLILINILQSTLSLATVCVPLTITCWPPFLLHAYVVAAAAFLCTPLRNAR